MQEAHASLVAAVLRHRLATDGQALVCCAVRDQASHFSFMIVIAISSNKTPDGMSLVRTRSGMSFTQARLWLLQGMCLKYADLVGRFWDCCTSISVFVIFYREFLISLLRS